MPIVRRVTFTGNVTRKIDMKGLLPHGKRIHQEMMQSALATLSSMREYEAAHGRAIQIHGYGTGGPFADHIPVDLYLAGEINSLTLHMPTEMSETRYNTTGARAGAAMTLNQSHGEFSRATGKASLSEIKQAIAAGAEVRVVTDLRERFGKISEHADTFVMFGFSKDNLALDLRSGDRHFSDPMLMKLHESSAEEAWRQAVNPDRKIFVSINRMLQAVSKLEVQDLTTIYANTPFDTMRRLGTRGKNTFEAIVEGSKTAITRYEQSADYDRIRALRPGDKIGLMGDFSLQRNRMAIAEVTSCEPVDLCAMSEAQQEEWSRAEGWAAKTASRFGTHLGQGCQVTFKLIKVPTQ